MSQVDNGDIEVVDEVPGCTLNGLSRLLQEAPIDNSSHRFTDLYSKEQRLRSGSYGTVYTCKSKSDPNNVTYAVKVMDRSKLKEKKSATDQVFREVKILHELTQSHVPDTPWHIVRLVDFFIDPSYLFIVQHYAKGGDLFDRLTSRRQYTEKDARDVAQNLLEAVLFLHEQNPKIAHRDLKPENLLLVDTTNDTQILLADFGFARQIKEGEKCHTRCGTPAYCSPEILLGLPYTVTVDLWSIGCVLYMLVAGYPPFQAPHHRALFRKIRAGDYVFHEKYWKNVSVPLKQLISHLLTVNATKRWTAEQALQCDWFKKTSADSLKSHDLSGSLDEMKAFHPKDAWKRAFNALGFCATAPFWNPDAISFSQQVSSWDSQVTASGAASAAFGVSSITVNTSATVPMNTFPKKKFGDRYELRRQLRKGSNATVWECVRKGNDSEVFAVKVIQREGLQPKDDEAVLNEVAMMQALRGNDYVVQILEFFEEKEYFYLVMEFCCGGDVFDRIVKYSQYTENDARSLARTLLKAVKSIHEAGLAHRDVKPQNLLLVNNTDNSAIKVCDFGFARRVHTPESLTSRVGTPTYVAPEILKNVPHDHRVDLWSIGVVVYIILVGYPVSHFSLASPCPCLLPTYTQLLPSLPSLFWMRIKPISSIKFEPAIGFSTKRTGRISPKMQKSWCRVCL